MSALEIENLQKTYRDGTVALRGIDLSVPAGSFYGLLGPNGAGKSTTINIVMSLVRRSGGSVRVFGTELDADPYRAKRQIGIVPQEFNFNQFEGVGQIVAQQAGYYGLHRREARRRAEKYLRMMGLWHKRDQSAQQLSGGLKRRLMIARALVHEPRLVILDEPTAGVDIELRRATWRFMQQTNEQGTTVILTTHYLEEAESLCRWIAIIDRGRIVEDTDTKTLLNKLHREEFILDLAAPVEAAPELNGYACRMLDGSTLCVTLEKGQSLNRVFAALSDRGIDVLSMRNRANRLEELFVEMTEANAEGASDGA